ncbi:hypothetical protein, partial [Stenotrophomonas maltophilia group sp. RNC7]|uniref:hypothetical protein n=1 Tax=Stenotrophomonas maltophilia group sp. RNC7 TaxID=3071467 RepID=UPI0027E16CEA
EYILAPEDGSLQMGWWGSQLSDDLCYFSNPYPTITLEFETDRSINAIKVVGDSLKEEYPVDYTIKIYGANENILVQREVTENTNINNITDIMENPTNSRKVEITITKWSHPNRQVKIVECLDVAFKLNIGPELYFRKNNPAKYLEVANYIEVPYGEEKVIVKDEDSIIKNGLLKYSLQSNPLIQTEERALDIANRLLEGYSNPRRDLDLEWRGNPALALGDTVSVIDNKEINDYKVVKQELEYTGYLRAKLSGRRV